MYDHPSNGLIAVDPHLASQRHPKEWNVLLKKLGNVPPTEVFYRCDNKSPTGRLPQNVVFSMQSGEWRKALAPVHVPFLSFEMVVKKTVRSWPSP